MLIYCSATDCESNIDGMCHNKLFGATQAISIDFPDNDFFASAPVCTDYKSKGEGEHPV